MRLNSFLETWNDDQGVKAINEANEIDCRVNTSRMQFQSDINRAKNKANQNRRMVTNYNVEQYRP